MTKKFSKSLLNVAVIMYLIGYCNTAQSVIAQEEQLIITNYGYLNYILSRFTSIDGRISDETKIEKSNTLQWAVRDTSRAGKELRQRMQKIIRQIELTGPAGRLVIQGIKPIGNINGSVAIADSTKRLSGFFGIWGEEDYSASGFNFRDFSKPFSSEGVLVDVFPFGHRTTYQFIGKVNLSNVFKHENVLIDEAGEKDEIELITLLKGYEFVGDGIEMTDRLIFAVIKNIGFVYVNGKGKVILPNGKVVELGKK